MSKAVILDEIYTVQVYAPGWAWSIEKRTVRPGDVRAINRVLFYASDISPAGFRRNKVYWQPVDKDFITYENFKKWVGYE